MTRGGLPTWLRPCRLRRAGRGHATGRAGRGATELAIFATDGGGRQAVIAGSPRLAACPPEPRQGLPPRESSSRIKIFVKNRFFPGSRGHFLAGHAYNPLIQFKRE
jgi:hypothetical protein